MEPIKSEEIVGKPAMKMGPPPKPKDEVKQLIKDLAVLANHKAAPGKPEWGQIRAKILKLERLVSRNTPT